jgi:hypothetical protein
VAYEVEEILLVLVRIFIFIPIFSNCFGVGCSFFLVVFKSL